MHFAYTCLQKLDTAMRIVSLCSAGRGGSSDMHSNLFRAPLDLNVTWPEVTCQNLTLTFGIVRCDFWCDSTKRTRWQSNYCSNVSRSKAIDEKHMPIQSRCVDLRGQQLTLGLKKWYHQLRLVAGNTPFLRRSSWTRGKRAGAQVTPCHVRRWEKPHMGEG